MGFLESLKKLFGKKEEEKKVDTANQNATAPDNTGGTTDQNQNTL